MRRLILLLSLLLPGPVFGANYAVQSLLDYPDSNVGDGVCNSTQNASSNDCTLRAAIEEANSHAGADTISFNVSSGSGALVISLTAGALPSISDTVTIDGRTAAGYSVIGNNPLQSRPRIFISGGSTGGSSNGFRFLNSGADGSAVYAIGIVNFPGDGIELFNADSISLDANWIGLNWNGSSASANATGINVLNSNGIVIGTSALSGIGNVISGNTNQGIIGAGSFIFVDDNHIGITSVGGALGNGTAAIDLLGADITITNNHIRYSPIGIRVTGAFAKIDGNRVLNNGDGIKLAGDNSTVNDNEVGSSSDVSIEVTSTDNATISNNFIYSSASTGILIGGGSNHSDYNDIFGNEIKTVSAGAAIFLLEGVDNDVYENRIYDISAVGIHVKADGNFIAGNNLGFTEGPLQIQPIAGNGIVLQGESNQIGKKRDGTESGNTIATGTSNWMDGIDIWNGQRYNLITENFIGAMPDGTELGVGGHGVRIDHGVGNIVNSNIIGFAWDGVHVISDNAINRVCGNQIGVIQGATPKDIGNRGSGIFIDGNYAQIRHDPTCATFVESQFIGFNQTGITVNGNNNVIQGVFIGGSNSTAFGNDNQGIVFQGSSTNNSVLSSRVRSNGATGIVMESSAGTSNYISGNTLTWGNVGGMGIDLGNDGITANDSGDVDSGPNRLMNYPVISLIEEVDGNIETTFQLDYNATETSSATVYFYLADGNSRQGEILLASFDYDVAADTAVTKTMSIPDHIPVEQRFLVAMAEDSDKNTSEYSAPIAFMVPAPSDIVFKDSFED